MSAAPLILDQSIRNHSVPQQFIAFANSYRNSAEALCEKMIADGDKASWPDAAVVLLTAAHATELFLKGMILARNSTADIKSHNIDLLAREFRRTYPEMADTWNIPFETEFLGIDPANIDDLIKKQVQPSIRYRYPVANNRSEWNGVSALRAATFKRVLTELESKFKELGASVA